jgi:hypothetical protein
MRFVFLIMLTVITIFVNGSVAGDSASFLVEVYGSKCTPGLHPQPRNGPFSVFVFCDDALGSNIGIVLTNGSAVTRRFDPFSEGKWDTNNRFWQDPVWATDVKNFAWSPDLRYLYVATSSIYGNGGFYKLDLIQRKVTRLIPSEITPYFKETKYAYDTEIKRIDLGNGQVEVSFDFFNVSKNAREIKNIIIK